MAAKVNSALTQTVFDLYQDFMDFSFRGFSASTEKYQGQAKQGQPD